LIGKFKNLCAELGPGNAVLWAANRLFETLGAPCRIIRYYFVAQPVAEEALLPPRRGRSIDVRRLSPDDSALRDLPLTDDVLRYRFDQDAVCFGAFQNGAIVGCLWLCLDSYDEDEVRCTYALLPERQAAWDFDVYVVPEARGGFAFLRLWDEAYAFLRELGVHWSLSRISAFNPGSLGAHGNLGARRISSALFVRIGRLQLLLSSLSPYLYLSVSKDRRPRLALRVNSVDPAE
jgi:hypothetical protein